MSLALHTCSHPHVHILQTKDSYKPVSANGHTLKDPIRSAGDYVVEFVGHAAGAGHIGHAAWAVELGGKNVIQHTSCVPNFKTAWLDTSNLQPKYKEIQVVCLNNI